MNIDKFSREKPKLGELEQVAVYQRKLTLNDLLCTKVNPQPLLDFYSFSG